MKLLALRPILRTLVMQDTLDFYTHILGFTLGDYNPQWGWASLHRDGVDIMVATPNAHTPFHKAIFTGSFYFETENADTWWQQINDKVRICYPIEKFEFGMLEFGFFDNNGYLLQIGSRFQEAPAISL